MEERPRYFALLVLSMFIATCMYMSWVTDRGQGEVVFETYVISDTGFNDIVFDVYKPRNPTYSQPLPIVLTIHGIGSSKEMMYAFNIELARRNFTVVSVDLPGHGDDATSFNVEDIQGMAETCYVALDYIWDRNSELDNSTYGIVAHSMGLDVAFAMTEMEVVPSSIVAIGSVGNLGFSEPSDYSGNLLYIIGTMDELVSASEALNALSERTGLVDVHPDIVYGSIEHGNATQLIFPVTDHILEPIDNRTVSETLRWMVASVQGESHIGSTLPYNDHVFKHKTFAMAGGAIAMVLALVPLLLILNSIIPRPSNSPKDEIGFVPNNRMSAILQSFILSCLIGVIYVGTIVFSPTAMGIILFAVLAPVGVIWFLRTLMGNQAFRDFVDISGIQYKTGQVDYKWLLRGIIISSICIAWLWVWTYLGFITGGFDPRFVYPLVRIVSEIRVVQLAITTIFLVPFFMFETTWVRSVVITQEKKSGYGGLLRRYIWTLICRLPGFVVVFVVGMIVLGLFGIVAGFSLMIGLYLLLFLVAILLETSITLWADYLKMGPWVPTLFSSVLFSWLIVSIIPLL